MSYHIVSLDFSLDVCMSWETRWITEEQNLLINSDYHKCLILFADNSLQSYNCQSLLFGFSVIGQACEANQVIFRKLYGPVIYYRLNPAITPNAFSEDYVWLTMRQLSTCYQLSYTLAIIVQCMSWNNDQHPNFITSFITTGHEKYKTIHTRKIMAYHLHQNLLQR